MLTCCDSLNKHYEMAFTLMQETIFLFLLLIYFKSTIIVLVRQQNAQYWPDPKFSDIIFFSADYLSLGST